MLNVGINEEELYEVFAIANEVGATIVIPHLSRSIDFWEELNKL